MENAERPLAEKDWGDETERSDEQKKIEAARRAELDKFGYAGVEELARLENAVEDLTKTLEASPDDGEAAKQLELEKKRLELFMNERDNAGAFKFKRFGRELRSSFEDRPDAPKMLDLDRESGKITLADPEKGRRLLFVNMGELDRFNKEGGGHAAGDSALADASRTIEKIVRDRLKDKEGEKTGYKLLRYSGNEFMVSFSDVSKEDIDAIQEAINDAKPGKDIPGVSEGAPLAAVSFEMAEAVEIVNQLQVELGKDERISMPEEANRELVEVMRQRANYALDIVKFKTRVDRIRDKLHKEDPGEVKKFYDNYMAKMFRGTALDSVEKFADLDRLTKPEAETKVGELAFEATKQRLSLDTQKNDLKRGIIDQRVKEIRDRRMRQPSAPQPENYGPLQLGEVRVADIPDETEGQRLLRQKKETIGKAAETGDAHAVEMAKIEVQIEEARRDEGTGLLQRGVHYEALEKKFEKGEKTSVVFVDMGFLKYFDQKGGADVGDKALKLAAEMMTQAIKEAGVKGEAYRYGGDEFTVQLDGGQDEVAKFQEKLQEIRSKAGGVGQGKKGSKDGYVPTELVFNYGAADMDMAEDAFNSLKEAGVYEESELEDPSRVANIKAEVMTIIADKSIESEKAVNRFLLLVERLRDIDQVKDQSHADQLRRQTNDLISFSSKAIFGEAGGAIKLAEWATSPKNIEDMRAEIEDWVGEKVQESHEKEKGQKDLREQLVELHVRVWYYQQEIGRLTKLGSDQESRISQLEKQRDQAEKERQSLLDIRKNLE